MSQGDYTAARSLYERSLALWVESNQPNFMGIVSQLLGELARAEGDLPRARNLLEQAASVHRHLDDKPALGYDLSTLGMVLIHFGELDRSQELLQERLTIQLELGGGAMLCLDLMGLAFLANARGQPVRAIRLLAASEALRKAAKLAIERGDRPDFESNLASLRAQLDPAAFEAAWAEGEELTVEQAVELARSDPIR